MKRSEENSNRAFKVTMGSIAFSAERFIYKTKTAIINKCCR